MNFSDISYKTRLVVKSKLQYNYIGREKPMHTKLYNQSNIHLEFSHYGNILFYCGLNNNLISRLYSEDKVMYNNGFVVSEFNS